MVICASVLAGCNTDCIDGVCADFDNTEHYAGPCRSAEQQMEVVRPCTFVYHDDHRLERVTCEWRNPYWDDLAESTWTWSGDAPSIVDVQAASPTYTEATRWSVLESRVRVVPHYDHRERIYDAATFAFLPLVGSAVAKPVAELGLIKWGDTNYLWTSEGNRLLRRGSDGTVRAFELDAAGRLVYAELGDGAYRYTWDEDQLVQRDTEPAGATPVDLWTYDLGGNVVEHLGPTGRELYDYDCW